MYYMISTQPTTLVMYLLFEFLTMSLLLLDLSNMSALPDYKNLVQVIVYMTLVV